MSGTSPQSSELKASNVAVIHGSSGAPDLRDCVPAGHCLSRARLRHLRESDWVVVTEESGPVGFAAYKRADSDVRVVHEFLLDRTLAAPDAARVTDVLLSALEVLAYDDGVRCLTFLLRGSVVMEPFERRGYSSLVIECACTWIQKKLGWRGWCEVRSERPH